MRWDRIIEDLIREAQAEGKFDNLAGRGRPLRLDEEPQENSETWAANHILKTSGFRPDWLEDDVALRDKLAQTRQALARTRDWRAARLAALGARDDARAQDERAQIADEWDRAVRRFREALAEINAGIARLNLKVPHPRFQRAKLDVEAELKRLAE